MLDVCGNVGYASGCFSGGKDQFQVNNVNTRTISMKTDLVSFLLLWTGFLALGILVSV